MASAAAIRPSMGALGRICSSAASAASGSSPRSTCAPTTLLGPLTQTSSLSTTASLLKRHKYAGARDTKDHNKQRGESALRRTGTRWRLSMSDEPLPRPVARDRLPAIYTDPDHGLWEFFANRTTVADPPAEDAKHGRSWTAEELRYKSWDDLHRLWWVCAKERNRIATGNWERNKSKLGFGESESSGRDFEVRATMRAIKHVLTERFYAWEDAVKLSENDPEVNLSGDGPTFIPSDYLEEVDAAVAEGGEQAAEETATIPASKPQPEAPRP